MRCLRPIGHIALERLTEMVFAERVSEHRVNRHLVVKPFLLKCPDDIPQWDSMVQRLPSPSSCGNVAEPRGRGIRNVLRLGKRTPQPVNVIDRYPGFTASRMNIGSGSGPGAASPCFRNTRTVRRRSRLATIRLYVDRAGAVNRNQHSQRSCPFLRSH